MQYLQDLKSKRSGKASVETLDEVDTPDTVSVKSNDSVLTFLQSDYT